MCSGNDFVAGADFQAGDAHVKRSRPAVTRDAVFHAYILCEFLRQSLRLLLPLFVDVLVREHLHHGVPVIIRYPRPRSDGAGVDDGCSAVSSQFVRHVRETSLVVDD